MQWTLLWGELQRWIRRAPAAFARYDIRLDDQRSWTFGKTNRQPAIQGVSGPSDLRWDGWAERFYLVGLDDDAIAAEIAMAREKLEEKLERIGKALGQADYVLFRQHYDRSLPLRGVFQEAYNNLPVAAKKGTIAAVRQARAAGNPTTDRFLQIFREAILAAYRERNDSAENLIKKTATGAQL
jgi:hypothetical protein